MDRQKNRLPDDIANKLQSQWGSIKHDVIMHEIVDHLIENNVLSSREWEDLKQKHSIEKNRTEEFLHLLSRSSAKCYYIFLEALRKHKYDFIVESLATRKHKPVKQHPSLQNSIRAITKGPSESEKVDDARGDTTRISHASCISAVEAQRAAEELKDEMSQLNTTLRDIQRGLHDFREELYEIRRQRSSTCQLF